MSAGKYTLHYFHDGGMHRIQSTRHMKDAPTVSSFYLRPSVMVLEIKGPAPLLFDLDWAGDGDAPAKHQTVFFPFATVVPHKALMDTMRDDKQADRFIKRAERALSFNYHFNGGHSQDPETVDFVMTPDGYVHAFADNCALLLPARTPVHDRVCAKNSMGDLWHVVTPAIYALER